MLINYKEQTGLIIDIAVPRDKNIQDKELEKIDKYQSLKIELEQLWKIKIVVIPVVVGALGAIADGLPGWPAQIPGTISEVELQKSVLLGTVQVLRGVLRLTGLWSSPESVNNTTHGRVRKNLNQVVLATSYYYHATTPV